jgi:hypothetical protein
VLAEGEEVCGMQLSNSRNPDSKETIVGNNIILAVALWITSVFCMVGFLFGSSLLPYRTHIVCGYLAVVMATYLLYDRTLYYRYGISSKGITEYFLLKRTREIPWKDVKQIGLQKDHLMRGEQKRIVVTLVFAERFPVGNQTGSKKYYRCYKPNVLLINPNQCAKKVIGEFYGTFDY